MNRSVGNTYYDESLKKRYIREKEKSLMISCNYIDTQFRKAAETEKEYGKDLNSWTLYEIIDYYKLLGISSFESLSCINSAFSLYTQFCLENNLVKDNQNHYFECTQDLLFSCINKVALNKKIVDRETILYWIDELPNPKDKFIILGLFEFGKSKDFKDIIYAKPENVQGNLLKLTDRTVKISNDLKDIIEDCVAEDKYYSISGERTKVMPLVDQGYIVKSYPNQNINVNDFQKGRNIYTACTRIFNYLGVGKWMSPNSIAESGRLYMIKEKAKEYNMNPIDYIYSDLIKEVDKQFNVSMIPSVYKKKYEEYLV